MGFGYKHIPLSKLTICQNNPRSIRKPGFENLKRSLEKTPDMLMAKPVIVSERDDGTLLVLGGNMRLRAAIELGWSKIYCCVISGLSPEKEAEYLIKDNTHYGEWDYDALANEWADFPGLDLIECGISSFELKGLGIGKLDLEPEAPVKITISAQAEIAEKLKTELLAVLAKYPGAELKTN